MMNQPVFTGLCALLLAVQVGCGVAPQVGGDSAGFAISDQRLQQLPFSGVADPAGARLRVVAGPQAALVTLTEDANGDPSTAAPATVQLYAPSVSFTAGGAAAPAACNPSSPLVMTASVEVLSGFTEQVRNVYARITSMSVGPTFCSRDSVQTFGASLNPNFGLYAYQPLDAGAHAASATRRTVQWALNLPDNSPFWFKGELWAEIVPQLPTLILPADGATVRSGDNPMKVAFSWIDDLYANGGSTTGLVVPRPQVTGAQVTVLRCGLATGSYDPATCLTTVFPSTEITGKAFTAPVTRGYWYQWSLRTVFRLPGDTATTIGTLVSTRSFRATR
jgi:hypothetical protein